MSTTRTPHRPKPTPTSVVFRSDTELEDVRKAARSVGKSVSAFIRQLAAQEAARILGETCPHCGSDKHVAA